MTALMVISLVVIGVSTVISTALLQRNKQTITSKALEATSCPNPDDNSKWYCAGECADQNIRDLFNGTYPPDGSDEWRNEKAANCHIIASQCQTTTSCSVPSPTPNCPAGKLNVVGACDSACCANDDQCKDNSPQPQRCLNPNGYCRSGTSCAVVNTQGQAQFIRKCSSSTCAWLSCTQSEIDAGECSTDTNNPNPKSLKCFSHTECGATPTITPYKSPTPGPSLTKAPSVTPGGPTLTPTRTPTPTPTIPASGDRLRYGINCPADTAAEIYVYSKTNEWPELFINATIGREEGPMAQDDIQPKRVDPQRWGHNSVDYYIEAKFPDGKIEKHDLFYRYPNNCSPSYSSTPPSATPTPQKSPTPSSILTPSQNATQMFLNQDIYLPGAVFDALYSLKDLIDWGSSVINDIVSGAANIVSEAVDKYNAAQSDDSKKITINREALKNEIKTGIQTIIENYEALKDDKIFIIKIPLETASGVDVKFALTIHFTK